MYNYRLIKLLNIFIISFLSYTETFANSLEKKHAISNLYIKSNSLIIDRIKEKIEYIGKVVVYFDDAILNTEILEVYYKNIDNKKTIDHIVIPKKLTVKRQLNSELLIADSAKYFLNNKQLILLGNVMIQHNENILKTNKLIYYLDLKTVLKQ